MGKAVYVFDMPMCCYDCPLFEDNWDYPYCNATEEIRGYKFRAREEKMGKCPLREMPEKVDMEYGFRASDYCSDYDDGWNACIDEILKTT